VRRTGLRFLEHLLGFLERRVEVPEVVARINELTLEPADLGGIPDALRNSLRLLVETLNPREVGKRVIDRDPHVVVGTPRCRRGTAFCQVDRALEIVDPAEIAEVHPRRAHGRENVGAQVVQRQLLGQGKRLG